MSGNPIQQVSALGRDAVRPGAIVRLALIAAILVAFVAPGRALALELQRVNGHMEFGYGRLVISDPPAGSLTMGAGFDYPITPRFRGGLDLGFYLFGSRSVTRGSLNATLDYSAVDLIAFSHWNVPRGPFSRVSIGPGLTAARAAISTSAGGASFLDLAVSDLAPTAALDLTMMRRKPSPVRIALVLSARSALRRGEDWNHFSARFGFHY
jgi:hypothetical protein